MLSLLLLLRKERIKKQIFSSQNIISINTKFMLVESLNGLYVERVREPVNRFVISIIPEATIVIRKKYAFFLSLNKTLGSKASCHFLIVHAFVHFIGFQ